MAESSRLEIEEAYRRYRESHSEEDLEALVKAGRRLVCHFVRLFSRSMDEDLVQAGMEGLLKAVARFEDGRGAGFVTFAGHCIMGEIRHYIRKENAYYYPGCLKDLQNRVEKVVEEGLKTKGEPPGLDEIARALNVKQEGVVEAMRAGLVSLDEVHIKEIKNLKYESFRLPIEEKVVLEQAFNRLNELQKRVIDMLFFRDMTQVEAARALGINQRKVSRVLHKSLETMARMMGKQ